MERAEELAKEYAEKFFLTVDHQGGVEEAYIDGYHQAEEDLTDKAKVSSGWDGFYYGQGYKQAEKDLDISWVKEVSGVKELSRAKEEALKAYPPQSIAANYGTIDRRDAFEYGYLKAEKDLELTWEDLAIIKQLSDDFVKHNQTPMSDEEFYKEILKRFKERKEK